MMGAAESSPQKSVFDLIMDGLEDSVAYSRGLLQMEPTDPTILQDEIDMLRAEVEVMTAERKRAGMAATDSMSRIMYAKEIAAIKKALRQAIERIEELERQRA